MEPVIWLGVIGAAALIAFFFLIFLVPAIRFLRSC